ncbi:MAG TPA: AmmeMemoRadiSam system protein A [Phycisphaerae bacterium]|nr:AmmeMemoRadiSam system protein A [Phycisphaerae bacterium]
MSLDPAIHSRLLSHARGAIASYLTGEELPPWDLADELPQCGVFVTLRRGEHLRGCIGIFSATEDLPTTIARMAIASARDPRFVDLPVSARELADLRIELSLLSPLEAMADPMDFEIGRHGIYISHGYAVGCFLPDVATEHGWDKITFLTQCCMQKAGLSPDAWSRPDIELFRFSVEKVSD